MASTSNEPLAKLQTAILAIPGLATYLGTRVARGHADQLGGFPCLAWTPRGPELGPVDAERWLWREYTVQIDLFGADPDELEDIKLLVDGGLNGAHAAGALDSSGWRITVLRRSSAWRPLVWTDKQTSGGNQVHQATSDWLLRALKKQQAS